MLAASQFSQMAIGAEQDEKLYEATVSKAIAYLAKAQAADGSISSRAGIGPTALATTALLQCGRTVDDPQVAKSLKYLEGFVQPDGGIYKPNGRLPNYETCIALSCFHQANKDGRYDKVIKNADTYIRGGQIDEADGKDKSDVSYGGAGYGGSGRPDLSNTAFLVEALKNAGAKEDDEAIQKALIFVSRCQNLETEFNTTPFASKINDGGFYYTGAVESADAEKAVADGGLRSYGAMTYSGLKSMVYAGLSADDPRMKAAVKWIQTHYDLTTNPGMGDAGLYYYYVTFAKALDAMGQEEVLDKNGDKHNWRAELTAELAKRQQQDGSWANSNTRWFEGDPGLSTSFALLALSYCRPPAAEN